jgi:F420-dependent oxidoreductase-like protein
MDLGLHYWNFSAAGNPQRIADTLAVAAQTAEEAGFAEFSVMDHYFQIEQRARAEEPMLEAYTTLGYVAAVTKRMRLAVLVTGVMYRHPGLLAKIVTTLDIVSGGRAQLGLGAAWYEREHLGLGVPFPDISERFDRLEETLQICHQMWSDDDGPFDGRYYQLAETICSPPPIQQPAPKILVGGSGERKTLRLVARYADACNLFAPEPSVVAHKLEVLARHCEAEGRDPDTIKKTILGFGDPFTDADAFLTDMEDYAKLGVDLVEVMPLSPDPVGWVQQVTEQVLPRLRDL